MLPVSLNRLVRRQSGVVALRQAVEGDVRGDGAAARAGRIVEAVVPGGVLARGSTGLPTSCVRRRDLAAGDVVGHRDLRLTAAPLTTLEAAVAVLDGSTFLDRALQRHVRFPAV